MPRVPSLNELKSVFPTLKAIYFDMDGTLLNTEIYHAQAMFAIGQKYNIKPPHSPEVVHDLMVGKADHLVFDIIKNWEGVPKHWTAKDFIEEKNVNVISILKKTDPNEYLLPETLTLLNAARSEGIYLALITSSEKVITEELLNLCHVRSFFDLVITRDDCPKHKPDPYPYLMAMKLSKHDTSEVVIFEDSHVGLEAALTSGAHVCKVGWYP